MESMKSFKFSKYIIILCFFIMIINPAITLVGAQNGLMLWFNVIIPSLLPSIIISNFIVSVYGESFKNPFAYIIFTGLLCGYPLGAATSVQLSDKCNVPIKKLQFLMAVCNNSSPMFITNYIIFSVLKLKTSFIQIIIIIYLPLLFLLFMFMIHNQSFSKDVKRTEKKKNSIAKKIDMHSVDSSIMAGFEIVTKVGGYIILFSIFGAYIQTLPIQNQFIKGFISGVLEITTGINYIGTSDLPMNFKILLACCFTAFGGLSCIAQTSSIIHKSQFSIKKYIYHKILITLLTLVVGYFLIYVF